MSMTLNLQDKLLELKEDQQRAEMDLKEVTKENESLRGPLKEAQTTVEELTQKMSNYLKDKQRLMASLWRFYSVFHQAHGDNNFFVLK